MPTIALKVSAPNQDCLVYKDSGNNWQFDLDSPDVAVGYHGPTKHCQGAGLYFPNCPIPPGSTIKQAFLILRSSHLKLAPDVYSTIYVEENANPIPFSTLADYDARSRWIVLQHWHFHYEEWQKDVLYASPDLSKFVQKVIDLPAWLERNSIVFFWEDRYGRNPTTGNTEHIAYSFNSNPLEAPRLEITFEPPAPPPSPPPALLPTPPPPPRKGWAGLDLQYEYLYNGFKLTFHTDVPCHLYCRMTKTPPRRHSLPSYRRGLFLSGDIRFCFVVYEDNEQEESGDTLIHTFLKPNWPDCETRWFYFIGLVYGDESPSESAIFKFHFRKEEAPPAPDIMWTFNSIEPQRMQAPGVEQWINLDMSHAIPPYATGAIIQMHNTDPGSDMKIGLRKPGDTHIQQGRLRRACQTWGIVGLDSGRNFEAYADTAPAPVHYWVMGYTGPTAHFLTTSFEFFPPALSWFDLDCSGQVPGDAIAAIWDISHQGYAWRKYAIRKKGSTDNHYGDTAHNWAIVGLDDNKKCQCYFEGVGPTRYRIFLVGYITSGIKMQTNGIDRTPPAINVWTATTLSSYNDYTRWGIVEVMAQPLTTYGAQKRHSLRNLAKGSYQHDWSFVHCRYKGVVELYMSDWNTKFYELGVTI